MKSKSWIGKQPPVLLCALQAKDVFMYRENDWINGQDRGIEVSPSALRKSKSILEEFSHEFPSMAA